MAPDPTDKAGQELVKKDLITQEDLQKAKDREAKTGTPWYKQLLQMRKVSFDTIEDVLRMEFHSPARRSKHEALGKTLVQLGMLSEEKLQKALAEQSRTGRLLGEILLSHGYITAEQKAQALARQYDLEYAPLEESESDPGTLRSIPEAVALKNAMIPLFIEGDKLFVLIDDPQYRERLKDASVLLGKRIQAQITGVADIKAEIQRRYAALKDSSAPAAAPAARGARRVRLADPSPAPATPAATATEETAPVHIVEEPHIDRTPAEPKRFDAIAKMASGSSVINMVTTIVEGAINSGATDVHLDPQDPEMRVRYRIDGILHDVMSIPESIESAVVSRIKIIGDLDITETRHPQDGHFRMESNDRDFDVRVATMPTVLGERVVLRILDQASVLSGIKDLGLDAGDTERLSRIIEQPYGMILVTGPTGSGKTTTLYAALNQKNVMTDSLVTLEDPVEYQLSGINQVQIDPDIDLTFANTLRAALRQDIDVLLIGEIRDAETARIAVRAAMTGHLVFSTLHTNDAPEAIGTLRNMGVPSYLITSALTAVVGQRLIRTICPKCKAAFKPSAALLKSIGLPATVKSLYRGKGCDNCYHTGNRGRTGIFEILEITLPLRKLIAEEASGDAISTAAKLRTMAMHCRQKVKDGEVAPEEFLQTIRT